MRKRISSGFSVGVLLAATLLASSMPAEAQQTSRPLAPLPIVRAYEAWVNQGIRSGRFVRRCASLVSEGLAYPTTLPPTVKREGQKTVYGDINNDGVTDFIAQVWSIECIGGNALWNGEFIIGVSQGASFSFGRWGDSIHTRYLGPIDGPNTITSHLLLEVTAIQGGIVSGVFLDNDSRIRGRCEGFRDNSNVRRSFQFDATRGQLINVGSPVIDREWPCF